MKRISQLLILLPFLVFSFAVLFPGVVSAQSSLSINIPRVEQGINPNADLGLLISRIITIVFVIATIAVLFMLIFGAFQWITSGGEKEAVGNARKRIVNALVGLAILALAFLLVRVVGSVIGINILSQTIPTLNNIPNAP